MVVQRPEPKRGSGNARSVTHPRTSPTPALASVLLFGLSLAVLACSDDGAGDGAGTVGDPSSGGADDVDPSMDDGGTPSTMTTPGDDDGVDDGGPTSSTGTGMDDDTTAGPSDTGTTGDVPEPPAGWTCDPSFYGDTRFCDCGCGVADVDCADAAAASCDDCSACSPFAKDCTAVVDGTDNAQCGTGTCGNGMVEGGEVCDGDGTLPARLTCEELGFTGGTVSCADGCANVDLTACTGGPKGWTCPPEYYGMGDGCDCGCGVVDPDCADMSAGSCEFCNVFGSCIAFDGDCTGIAEADNSTCG